MIKFDGFDNCILGVASSYGRPDCLCYDADAIVDQLTRDLDCSWHEALEYAEFNIFFVYLGETTPVFLNRNEN